MVVVKDNIGISVNTGGEPVSLEANFSASEYLRQIFIEPTFKLSNDALSDLNRNSKILGFASIGKLLLSRFDKSSSISNEFKRYEDYLEIMESIPGGLYYKQEVRQVIDDLKPLYTLDLNDNDIKVEEVRSLKKILDLLSSFFLKKTPPKTEISEKTIVSKPLNMTVGIDFLFDITQIRALGSNINSNQFENFMCIFIQQEIFSKFGIFTNVRVVSDQSLSKDKQEMKEISIDYSPNNQEQAMSEIIKEIFLFEKKAELFHIRDN